MRNILADKPILDLHIPADHSVVQILLQVLLESCTYAKCMPVLPPCIWSVKNIIALYRTRWL